MDLTKYAALSFDCYGTLIDWEAGILGVLSPWAAERGLDIDEDRLLAVDAEVELGIDRDRLLHVAQSLFHDHVPARRLGLASVWINRRHDGSGWGATPEPSDEYSYGLEFASMREFADAAQIAFSAGRAS